MNPDTRLSAAFLLTHPVEAAHVLENFPANRVGRLLVTVRAEIAEKILEHIPVNFAVECLMALDPASACQIVQRVEPEMQVSLLRRVEASRREDLFANLEPELTEKLRQLLPYDEGTVGAIMDLSFVSVTEDTIVRIALKRARRASRGPKFYIYVTNTEQKLSGVITLHELMNASASVKIGSVMHRQPVSLPDTAPVWHVKHSPYWHQYHVLPVVGEQMILLGVLRQKTIRRLEADEKRYSSANDNIAILATTADLLSVTALQLLSTVVKVAGQVTVATSTKTARRNERR
jgi:magnesium transporter